MALMPLMALMALMQPLKEFKATAFPIVDKIVEKIVARIFFCPIFASPKHIVKKL